MSMRCLTGSDILCVEFLCKGKNILNKYSCVSLHFCPTEMAPAKGLIDEIQGKKCARGTRCPTEQP